MKTSLLVFAVATSVMFGTAAHAAKWHTPPASASVGDNHNNPTAGKPDLLFPDKKEENQDTPEGEDSAPAMDGTDAPTTDMEEDQEERAPQ